MAFGTKTKTSAPETAAEILAAVTAAVQACRNDPALRPILERHAIASKAAGDATTREIACAETVHRCLLAIVEPDLLATERRYSQRVADIEDKIAAAPQGQPGSQERVTYERLREAKASAERLLGDHRRDLASRHQGKRVPEAQLLTASPPLRQAYRAAVAELEAVGPVAKAVAEQVQDVTYELNQAKAAAVARALHGLQQLRARGIVAFNRALETASEWNRLLAQVDARIGTLGPTARQDSVCWRELGGEDDPSRSAKIHTWRESLKINAPGADIE